MEEKRVLENNELLVEVNDFGAELARICDKKTGREVLWSADGTYWNRHAPVLFPFVGALEGGGYKYNGQSYRMGQHGFARDSEFEFAGQDLSSVTHKLKWSSETYENYPFKFSLYITHTLEGRSIRVGWKVVSEQEEKMYFSIGAHPAFIVPAKDGEVQEDYFLNLYSEKDAFTCLRINEKGTALADAPEKFTAQSGLHRIEKDLFNDGVWIFEDGQLQKVGISYPDRTPYIEIECRDFPYVGIWTKPGAPFVCLEPWYGRTDDAGFAGDISEKKGIRKLDGGESFEASYEIKVF